MLRVNQDRLIKYFDEIVRIDSLPFQEKGVADYVRAKLLGLGCTVREDDAGEGLGGNSGNLVAVMEGTGGVSRPTVMLSAHMDRVIPGEGIEPVYEDDTVRSSGRTILGADDGAGLAIILEVLTVLSESGVSHGPIEVVLTVAEERGLLGAKWLDKSQLKADFGYVLDSVGRPTTVIVQAPSQVTFEARVKGKSAHAGMEPEKGVDAVKVSAKAIARMSLGRIDHETTANIGVIRGGDATNIVCDEVRMEGEVRSLSQRKLKDRVKSIKRKLETTADEYGAKVEFVESVEYHTFRVSEEKEVCQALKRAADRLGMEIQFTAAGGGSDANLFNFEGIDSIIMGSGYYKPHTTEEYMRISQVAEAATLLLEVLTEQERNEEAVE